jgi:hypothetical protein
MYSNHYNIFIKIAFKNGGRRFFLGYVGTHSKLQLLFIKNLIIVPDYACMYIFVSFKILLCYIISLLLILCSIR